jgi:hypothetical protein
VAGAAIRRSRLSDGLHWAAALSRLPIAYGAVGLWGAAEIRKGRSRSMESLKRLAVVLLLLLALGCPLAGCASSSTTASNTSGTSTSTTLSTAPSTTPTSTTQSRAARPLGPLAVVQRYWRDIASGSFAAAYVFLAAGSVPQNQAQFVSDERAAQIQSVGFRGSLVPSTGSSATVAVDSLTTTDEQSGCRTWTGDYILDRSNNRWRITQASITPAPCLGAPNSSGTATSTVSNGATGAGTSTTPVVAEGPGSYSHAGDTQFCSTGSHVCIPNFPNGNGYVVQCVDGEWSHSGGLSGACSDHGGER